MTKVDELLSLIEYDVPCSSLYIMPYPVMVYINNNIGINDREKLMDLWSRIFNKTSTPIRDIRGYLQ